MSKVISSPLDETKHYFRDSSLWANSKWFISGAISGMANTMAGHPFDTLKVRMQTEGVNGRFNGVIDCLRKTIIQEGFFRGLYKGFTPPFWGMGIINMSMFGFYGTARNSLAKIFCNGDTSKLTLRQLMFAGFLAGIGCSFVVAPIEQVKCLLQVQYANSNPNVQVMYKGPIDCMRKLIRNNGVFRGLYNGLLPTIMTRMNCWAYFGGQEFARDYYIKKYGKITNSQQFITGGFAGTVYWIIAFPFDVVKNRIMSQPDVKPLKYPTVWSCWKQIYQVDGWRGFTRGFIPCAMRTVPANGLTFLALKMATDGLEYLEVKFL